MNSIQPRVHPGKVWLAEYPAGVPALIDPDRYRSLVEVLDESFARYGPLPAFSNLGTTLSYQQLQEQGAAFGAFLQQQLNVGRGDRLAIMMPNLLQYPVVLVGALRAGLTIVNTNPLYTQRELEYQLRDSGATVIVILENVAHVLANCIERTSVRHVIVSRVGDMLPLAYRLPINTAARYLRWMVPPYRLPGAIALRDVLDRGARLELRKVVLEPQDLAFLQYTGGTTGIAKAAMLTHRNVVANLEQIAAWLTPVLAEGRERVVTALPLYHIFSLTANCLTFMKMGGLNYLITDPRNLRGFVKVLRNVRFTTITGVNALFNGLLNMPGFSELDFSQLKVSLAGGAALQESVARRWKQVTGSTLIEAYGLTEASPAACVNPLNLATYNGCIGLPLPSTEACIQDEAGNVLGPRQAGELCVRGPQVMAGYWKQPQETERVLSAAGWLRTGDIGQMLPDGYFQLFDRKKDVIVVGGFNVYPNEVEEVIAAHPQVREVGVIGVPDEHSGEAVMAIVVPRSPAVSEADIRGHCRAQLTRYKWPRYIRFAEQLPMTAVGKIARRELRERFGSTSTGAGVP